MADSGVAPRLSLPGQHQGKSLSVKAVLGQIGGDKNNKRLLEILQELDRDGSGTIDVAELLSLLEGVMNSRRERKYLCIALIGMFVFGLILIGTIIGLT
ncbi:hypothetical protein GPECTOR_85g358 [Gonium pectorale]|uniref:EF-hand domain-containing protein n=1 Tax=Gonium pectorale TaxID=33097 RepID=A0A150G1A7_GONPE|nr:hypothetical protein GPECTOR_85g358 [Gonium pectorale]|eukprot:KXZ43628.1 hypothetical protein GPECTOR_85g358 [Gonium pectorale]